MIIHDSIPELQEYTLVENNLLQEKFKTSYNNFLHKTKEAYSIYRQNFPDSDFRPYQAEYAALMCLRRYNIMGYSMGCGKTSITLISLKALYPDITKFRPGLIHISVPSLLAAGRWVEELNRMPFFADNYKVIKTEADLRNCDKQILIYSHDFPKGRSSIYKDCTNNSRSRALKKFFKPCYLIIDEGHGLKASTSRTRHLRVLRDAARRVMLISGTLSDGNLAQIHNTCKFIYFKKWPYPTAQSFSQVYGEKEKLKTNYLYGSTKVPDGPEKYLQRLDPNKIISYYKLMRRFVHRVRITEPQVAQYLTIPEQTVVIHKLEPTEEQVLETKKYIAQHKQRLIAASQSTNHKHTAEALQLIHPLIALANSPPKLSDKTDKTLEIVRQSSGKVIVFCSYVKSARLITSLLRARYKPESVVRLYATDNLEVPSQLTPEERQKRVDAFQYDPNVKVAVMSINLAAESIDLTKASDVIFYCMPWSVIKLTQALARAVRPGNRNKNVGIHYLLQQGLIDEHQVALSIEKVKGAKLLLDYETATPQLSAESELTPSEAIRRLLAS
jgi:hypothetical protein